MIVIPKESDGGAMGRGLDCEEDEGNADSEGERGNVVIGV